MDVEVSGTCDRRFAPVREAFAQLYAERPGGGPPDIGSSVALMLDGDLVVDLWAGHTDADRRRAWQRDTIVSVASVSKGIAALCAAMLVDRGVLDYAAPVCTYWPEFAGNGKAHTTVAHVLSHRAGLAHAGGRSSELFDDWDAAINALEHAVPEWEPGTAHGYHALSYGHLVGELVRRTDGRDIGTFIREEINAPLGVDLCLGLSAEQDARAAHRCLVLAPGQSADDPAVVGIRPAVDAFNRPAFRAAQVPAVGVHTDARSLARTYGALALGGALDGVQLVSSATLDIATTTQVRGLDPVRSVALPGCVSEYGMGWMLAGDSEAPSRHAGDFGHVGMFGASSWASRHLGLGFGYVANDCWPNEHYGSGDTRGSFLLDTARACL